MMPRTAVRRAGVGGALGVAFVLIEAIAARVHPGQGIWPEPLDTLGAAVLTAVLGAAVGVFPRGPTLLAFLWIGLVFARVGVVLDEALLAPVVLLAVLPLLRWPRAALLLAVASAAVPALLRPIEAASPGAGPDRVLITVDTLRADAELDLTGEWTRCDAVAPAPWTLPSVYSVMTGVAVRHHLGGLPAGSGYTLVDSGLTRLPERFPEAARGAFVHNPHLRQDLFGRGWATFGHADTWAAPHLLRHTVGRWGERLGHPDPLRMRRDRALAERALAWWDAVGPGRLLWLHLLGPHEYRRFGDGSPEAYAEHVAQTGRVVDEVVARLGTARIVITSDHGERLTGPSPGHGKDLADDQVRVPLWTNGAVDCPDQLAVQDVGGMLDGTFRGRSVVELGGVRRDATAFEARTPEGHRVPRSPPSLPGAVDHPDATWVERLRALGYVVE